jgi:colanic acid/amylovoran biosynthesis glycosyltransferase
MGWEMLPFAKRFNIPLVVSFYGYDCVRLPQMEPIWKARYQQLFQYASDFLVEGPHGASLLENMGCPKERIRILSLPAPEVSEKPVHQTTALNILQVSNYRPKKGYEMHIEGLVSFARCRGSFSR